MAGWVLVHDPSIFFWRDLDRLVRKARVGERVVASWECGGNRQIRNDDRVFFLRIGKGETGIFGVGKIIRAPREEPRTDVPTSANARVTTVVDVEFDILTGGNAVLISKADLQRLFPAIDCASRSSASRPLPPALVKDLEAHLLERTALNVADDARPEVEAELEATPFVSAPADASPPATNGGDNAWKKIVVGAYFAQMGKAVKGENADLHPLLKSVREGLVDNDKLGIQDGLNQVAALASKAGLPLYDRITPREPADPELIRHFGRFLQDSTKMLEALTGAMESVSTPRWPHVEDSRLYWTSPPESAWKPDRACEVVRNERHRCAISEQFNDDWNRSARQFAFEYEKVRLWQTGLRDRANAVRLLDSGAQEVHDIESFEPDGRKRFISVKATRFNRWQPFAMSGAEVERACRGQENHFIYRLFDALIAPRFFFVSTARTDGSAVAGILDFDPDRLDFRAPILRQQAGQECVYFRYFV